MADRLTNYKRKLQLKRLQQISILHTVNTLKRHITHHSMTNSLKVQYSRWRWTTILIFDMTLTWNRKFNITNGLCIPKTHKKT